MKLFSTAVIAAIASLCALSAGAAPGYRIVHEVGLSGDDGWDYLNADAGAGRLYVTHGSKVQVLKSDDLTVLGEIAATPGVHGVAIATDLGRGYISAGKTDTIVVFDLHTLARLQEIKSGGANPDAILYDPGTHQVFSFNGRGRNATVIDATDNKLVATIDLQAKPEFAVTDLAGHIYVNLEDTNSIAVIDAREHTVQKTWKLAGCEEPTGLAMDRAHQRLFSVCSNKVMAVIDAQSGKILAMPPIGARVDGVAFDPAAQLVFASGGDGTLTVVHEDTPGKFSVVQTATTRPGARTLAVDEKTHRVFTVTAKYSLSTDAAGKASGRPMVAPGTFTLLVLEP
ncbi:MAG TPA: hypothetical protein VGN07_03375 [Steroidobacteraceae bacterium]|jgi:DNA-binding beta-propeller fold protein YncE